MFSYKGVLLFPQYNIPRHLSFDERRHYIVRLGLIRIGFSDLHKVFKYIYQTGVWI